MLKVIRYEDVADNKPPILVASINPPLAPSSATLSRLREANSVKRPHQPPKTRTDVDLDKRDSAIAPSVSTAKRASYAESHQPPATADVAHDIALPTIEVQDYESAAPVERSKSPYGNFSWKLKQKEQPASQSQLTPASGIQRMRSFRGIPHIHTSTFSEFEFGDLATDKVGFSNRGSLLFGGRKMDRLLATPGDGAMESKETVQPTSKPATTLAAPATTSAALESPSPGLVTGRRQPSVHMLQAALQGGRVLSAEEIGLSWKVRNMYEHGDERAAEWARPSRHVSGGNDTPESLATNSGTPDLSINGVVMQNVADVVNDQDTLERLRKDQARKSFSREPHEFAGGIEDWQDVEGRDVDRYGFIVPNRAASRQSVSMGIHRVATALRLETEQTRGERKLQRGVSVSRSSRSVPAVHSGDNTLKKSTGSIRSFRSGESRQLNANFFRSRQRKTLAEAPDMLTLPPGLADVAEQRDNGRAAAALQQRERSRDEKWQKMARAVRVSSDRLGGGMHFEFDTSDPKLVNRTWKGIPDRWRATAWHSFLTTSARRRGNYITDDELAREFYTLQEMSAADDVQIDVDVPRTINMHIMFRRRYRGGQRLLFRVLHAISLYCPESGYVQGMASLAATLLCYYDEEKAFVMMVRLWQLRGLEHLFQSGFAGLLAALSGFEKDWLRNGDVARQLEELSIPSTSYGTRWYLTLFNLSLPFPAQLRIWDVFMLLGDAAPGKGKEFGGADLDVLHAASAALIDATREIILDADFETAMKVLTSFIPIKDEDLLMRVAMTEYKLRKKRAGGKA